MKEFRILDNADAVVLELAASMKSLSEQGRPVHISLSGGSTPKLLFKLLAQPEWANSIQWQNLHFWWGDERCVAPDDAESNYGEANALLFSQIAIPAENIHRIRGEDDSQQEAKRLADEIKAEVPEKNGYQLLTGFCLAWAMTATQRRCSRVRLTTMSLRLPWLQRIHNLVSFACRKVHAC